MKKSIHSPQKTRTAKTNINDRMNVEKELHFFNRLLEISNRNADISRLLKEYTKEVRNFIKCSAVGIRLLDEEGNIPYKAYEGFSRKFYKLESPLSIKKDKCICIDIIRKKTTLHPSCFTKSGAFYSNSMTKVLASAPQGRIRDACSAEGYESLAVVPIISEVSVLGLILVADTRENSLPARTVFVLEKAAAQLGTTIRRVITESSLQDALYKSRRREAKISALLKGSRAVLESRDFNSTARFIFDSCKNIIGASAGYVALLSVDGKENEVQFLDAGGLPCSVDPNLPMPIRGLRAETYMSGRPVYHNDFSESPWTGYLPEGHVALKNVLFAPLVIEDQIVGVLGLANKPEDFTENDVRMANAFSELASIALRNSRNLELLENSEERFRSVAETANDAIISIDARGTVVQWNRGAEKIFGYTAREVIGRPLTIIIPDSLRLAHKDGLNRVVSGGKPKIIGDTVEIVGSRKNGSTFPLELSLAKWRTREGTFFTGIIRDITQRKEIEEELRSHRERLMELVAERTYELQRLNEELEQEISERALAEKELRLMALFAELNPSPVLRFDKAGRILMANPAAMKVFNRKSLSGVPLSSILSEIDYPELTDCIINGAIISRSAQIDRRFFHFIIKGLPDLGFGQIYGSDITEQKKAEAETLRATHLASLGELAAGVAHEINNPINGIINYTQILSNKSNPGSREHDIACRIIKEGDRIAGIVKCLLSFACDSKEEKYPVHLLEIISDTIALTEAQMRKDGIRLRINVPAHLPEIIAHPQQIQQVFLNLISNARYALNQKFQGENKDKILDITGEAITNNYKPYVRIIFYDKGTGISDDIMNKVMNPFVSTKPSSIGTGLGLSISHGIVADHGGFISIDSVDGEYTKVAVELPVNKLKNSGAQ